MTNIVAWLKRLKIFVNPRGYPSATLQKKLGVTHCCIGRIETCERRLDIIETINLLKTLELPESEIAAFIARLL